MLSAGRTLAGLFRFGAAPAVGPVPVAVKGGMDYARVPDPRWQAALDAECPPADRMARLVVAWDAGDAWQPIHRWFIWQVQPWADVPAAIQGVLNGPNPRLDAEMREEPTEDGELVMRPHYPHAKGVSRRAWELHHQLKVQGIHGYPRRFWVIQGNDGGHPYALSRAEERLWRMQRRPHPSAGDLPYAEFDQRVIAAIRHYDLWRWANQVGTPRQRSTHTELIRARGNDAMLESMRLSWGHWQNWAGETAGELRHAMRKDGMHYHRWWKAGERPRMADIDRAREQYLTSNQEPGA